LFFPPPFFFYIHICCSETTTTTKHNKSSLFRKKRGEKKVAAKAERKKRFFSLSLDQSDIIARTTLPTTRTTRYPLRKKTRTHFTRSRTKFTRKEIVFVLDFFECKERERERFCFPAFGVEERQSQFARNERETNLLGTHKKIKKRKQ
jgi:hypothetical protein